MTEREAARRSCHYPRHKSRVVGKDAKIISDYERGALVAGLLVAAAAGACMIHWAVM